MQNYIYSKTICFATSLKLNLPHRLCLWTFLILSNVLPIPESPKNIVNMNYITFDEPIGLFANDLMFYFHFLLYFKQLSLAARGKTHTTKSVRACQLINCTDYQFVYGEILVRTLQRWFWAGASKDIYKVGYHLLSKREIMGKAGGYRPILFKDRGSQKW